MKYYSFDNILKKKAIYNIVIGERSSGKTYGALKIGIQRFVKTGEQMAYIRRTQEDIRGKRAEAVFDAIVQNNEIAKITNGEFTEVYYRSGRWWLARRNEEGTLITDNKPFCYAFALSAMEHDKSTSYSGVTWIVFDEFIAAAGVYLIDEFKIFMNVLSTIIRNRSNVTIIMLGNTINPYCPYFDEMGLKNIKNMKPGNIDVYRYQENEMLIVAVEFTGATKKPKENIAYFSFSNPKLNMISGKGDMWQLEIYPHCPIKIKPADIVYRYFIIFDGETYQCEIIYTDTYNFTYIHRKTTPIKNDGNTDRIYSLDADPRPNWHTAINVCVNELDRWIWRYFATGNVFYQDNKTGNAIANYIKEMTRR